MLLVRDIMSTEVFALGADQPVDHAAWTLRFRDISGAPVRDAAGELIGVVSASDLADPTRVDAETVREAMTPTVWAVAPDQPVMAAVELMVNKGIHRVLVVREPRKLVGIVSAMDVMRALADKRLPGG